jgi:PAS domain S-box-containing protein
MYSVLYVDDELDLHDIVTMYLEETGMFRVISVVSAELAEEFLAATPVDAIISDYQMPGSNGIDFLKYVRERYGNIPFILFSGKGREEVIIEAINFGADYFLQKGGDPDSLFAELIHKLKAAILQRHDREIIRKSVELQRKAESIGHIGSWEYDARTGKLWGSDEALKIFGLSTETHEVTVEQVEQLIPDHERIRQALVDLIYRGSEYLVEYTIQPADGSPVRNIRSIAEPERDEQGNLKKIRGILLDISERKRVEEALIESEKKYRAIFEQTGTAMIIIEEGDTISLANQDFVLLSGYSSVEITGTKKWWDFVDPADREAIALQVGNLRYGLRADPYKSGLLLIDKQGQVKNVLLTLGIIPGTKRITASLIDVTDRALPEDTLKTSEMNHRSILDIIQAGCYRSSPEGYLTAINPYGAKILGYDSPDELIGKKTGEFLYANSSLCEELFCVRGHEGMVRKEIALRKKDGTGIPVLAGCRCLVDREGKYSGTEGFFQDIFPGKPAGEDLRETEPLVPPDTGSFRTPDAIVRDREFAEILNTPLIRLLAEDLYQIVPVAFSILDLKGKILISTGWQEICTNFHRRSELCRRICQESNMQLSREVRRDKYIVYRCGNGLWDMATPIYIGERHVGNLFIGQFLYDDEVPDRKLFESRAEKCGFDKDAYLKALSRVPRLSREMANRVMDFCTRFASLVSYMGYNNLQLAKSVASEKQVTEALRTSECRNAALLKAIPDLMFILSSEGTIREDSIQKSDLSSLPFNRIRGKNIRDIGFDKNITDSILTSVKTAIDTRLPQTREYVTDRPSGKKTYEVRLVALSNNEVLGIIRNITEMQQAKEKLRQQNEFLQLLIDTIPNPVFYKNRKGQYLGCNRAFERYLGIQRSEIVGKTNFDFHPRDRAEHVSRIENELLENPGTFSYEMSWVFSGSTRHVLASMATFENPEGSVDGILGVLIDITDLLNAQQAAQQANRKLNLLASITRHDILNKVTVILGKVRAVKKHADNPAILSDIGKIESATKTIRAQIEFSRIYQNLGTLDPQWQDMSRILGKLAVPGEIRMDIHSENFEIYADPMLEKVFHNLFENTLLHAETATAIRIYTRPTPGGLTLFFEDNGVGVPDEEKERIFEGGYGRTPGHGLFLVREILGITGISIRETGTAGKGSRFEILIPEDVIRKKTAGA